jgi:DNA-binding transcriptional LysR family regulator
MEGQYGNHGKHGMTLEQLRCFCAIVERGSFRAAAEEIHRSQPAVSQQLKALERELGKRSLIDRRTGRPTSLGRLVYERARGILLDTHALQAQLADLDEAAERDLRIGSSDTTALYLLPEHLRRLSERLPQTHITLINRSSDGIAELVARGTLDLGLVTLPLNHEELEERALVQQRLVAVLPAAHPLARARKLSLERLVQEPLLQLDPGTRTGALLAQYLRQHGVTPRVVLDSGSFEVIKRYVAEGLGVSFLPEHVVQDTDPGIAKRHLPGLPEVTIGAIWRRDNYLSSGARLLLELLENRNTTASGEGSSSRL